MKAIVRVTKRRSLSGDSTYVLPAIVSWEAISSWNGSAKVKILNAPIMPSGELDENGKT